MMNKKIYILTFALLASATSMAQNNLTDEGQYRYYDATQLWRNTDNAASLTLDSTSNRGKAEFYMSHVSGTYHRVQEGNQTNTLQFYTERYQKIGNYLYGYGKFDFNMGRTKQRAWSDVMRTYFSNPFLVGSDKAGKYDFQNFNLSAHVGTIDFNGWRFGMSLDYNLGDLSRLRDPRSRSRKLEYQLTPSVSYTIGNHTLGVSGYYNRYKESQPSLTTVQEDPSLYYYQMTGLEAATGTLKGWTGYSREYVNHKFGGELSYGFRSNSYTQVTSVSISRGAESIFEQYKREPGKYYEYNYKVNTQHRIYRTQTMHQIDAQAVFSQDYADEYRPKLIITIDSIHGYTSNQYINQFTYKKRYQLKSADVSLHYRANRLEGNSIKSYIGLQAGFTSINQKHLLPTSTFKYQSTDLLAEYGIALLSNHQLWIDAQAGYHFSNQAKLNLADATGTYAQSVLIQDLAYYGAHYFKGKLQITWQMPITIKGYRSIWYVKGYANTIQAQHSLNTTTYGFTIGTFN